MPEANVLFVVAAVVIAGLAGWVAVVMKTAKEPWARPGIVAKVARDEEPPLIGADDKVETKEESSDDDAQSSKEEAKKDDAEEAKKDVDAKKDDAEEAKKDVDAKKDDAEESGDDAKKDAKKA